MRRKAESRTFTTKPSSLLYTMASFLAPRLRPKRPYAVVSAAKQKKKAENDAFMEDVTEGLHECVAIIEGIAEKHHRSIPAVETQFHINSHLHSQKRDVTTWNTCQSITGEWLKTCKISFSLSGLEHA